MFNYNVFARLPSVNYPLWHGFVHLNHPQTIPLSWLHERACPLNMGPRPQIGFPPRFGLRAS